MSVLTPRTIVINLPTQGNAVHDTKHYLSDLDLEDNADGQPRKRRRLTHLTPEEKMMRRKLKNRVAAQTARDRKKAKVDEIEIMLAELENQNKKLLQENLALRQQTGSLSLENKQLKERLGWPSEVIVKEEKSVLPESAVLNVPLPQEHALALSPYMMHSVAFLMTFSLICLTSLTTLMKQTKVTPPVFKNIHQQRQQQSEKKPCVQILNKWWGPQQKSWTPSKN